MIYKGLDLVGIEEIFDMRGRDVMSRYPLKVNHKLGHNTAFQLMGQEIRLVPIGDVSITIGSMYCWTKSRVQIFYGDYGGVDEYVFDKDITIDVSKQQVFRSQITNVPKKMQKPAGFKNNVVRIVILSEAVYVKKISGKYRLPKSNEVPKKNLLVYGTSISQGCNATSPCAPYAFMLSRYLRANLYNYSLAGNAYLEDSVIDFLKTKKNNDYVVLELSVNMLTAGYSLTTFKKRCKKLINTIKSSNPKALIMCIGVLPFYHEFGLNKNSEILKSSEYDYRETLKKLCESEKVIYVNPLEIFSIENLSSDLLHPSNFGHSEIANNLYSIIEKESN